MRMPEPIPLGLTFLLAIVLAIVSASLVNKSLGGLVETVLTSRDHFFLAAISLTIVHSAPLMPPCRKDAKSLGRTNFLPVRFKVAVPKSGRLWRQFCSILVHYCQDQRYASLATKPEKEF